MSKRHAEIMRILDGEGTVTVAALADRLGVSAETVRRDVRSLADRGSILKMHGAIGLAGASGEAPFQRRMRENAEAKQIIARAFAALVRNGDSLFLDTGTTTSFLARALAGHEQLTVITNSTDAARILALGVSNTVFLAGGEMRRDSGAVLGPEAIAFASRFRATYAIISAGAIDSDGVMDFDFAEADFARAILSLASRRIVLTDASKFGRRGLVTVAGFDGIDEIFTDRAPETGIASAIAAAGTHLLVAERHHAALQEY